MLARASLVIAVPAERAFAFVAEPRNDPSWRGHLIASSGTANRPGDTVRQTYSYEGRTQGVTLEVVEFEPPLRLAYVIHEPTRIHAGFQFRPDGSGTRVSMSLSSVLTGSATLFEGRIQSEAERLIREDLRRLKTALEGS